MDGRKFEVIIHATDAAACQRLIQSLAAVDVPDGYSAAIQPVTGDEKFFAYNAAMQASDAKYKIYLDEQAVVTDANFLHELLKIFRDESIGAVEVADGIFFATQYDLPWREDLFADNFFGGRAQCVEFKRAGFKVVIGGDWIFCRGDVCPLVTVIIPTFNRPKFFREALESALNQTYRNIEIFVSDNSTDDATERLIQDYLARDTRIK